MKKETRNIIFIKKHLLDLINLRMSETNTSQTDIAKGINVSRQAVSKYFKNGEGVTIDKLIEIVNFLGVEIGITTKEF